MKSKKAILILVILLIIILVGGFFAIKYLKNKTTSNNETIQNEYTPEQEISDEQLRKTIVTLYFKSKETGELAPEARLIDIKEIINTPYEKLINLLIEGPKNDKYEKIIPDNTKLLNSYLEKDCLTLDFSSEILNCTNKQLLIDSIVNTMTELSEVNKIKILVDGKTNSEFSEEYSRQQSQ